MRLILFPNPHTGLWEIHDLDWRPEPLQERCTQEQAAVLMERLERRNFWGLRVPDDWAKQLEEGVARG